MVMKLLQTKGVAAGLLSAAISQSQFTALIVYRLIIM
jgi:hypothetical protein